MNKLQLPVTKTALTNISLAKEERHSRVSCLWFYLQEVQNRYNECTLIEKWMRGGTRRALLCESSLSYKLTFICILLNVVFQWKIF